MTVSHRTVRRCLLGASVGGMFLAVTAMAEDPVSSLLNKEQGPLYVAAVVYLSKTIYELVTRRKNSDRESQESHYETHREHMRREEAVLDEMVKTQREMQVWQKMQTEYLRELTRRLAGNAPIPPM